MAAKNSFSKSDRLITRDEFAAVYNQEHFAADDVLVIRARRNDSKPRLGLAVSRKVGNAVVRNRWKRSIREAFRLQKNELPALDIVIRPRKGAVCDHAAIFASLAKLMNRLDRKIPCKER